MSYIAGFANGGVSGVEGNFGKSFSPPKMEDDLNENHLIRDVVGRTSVSSVCMM